MKIVNWNCFRAFRNKYKALLEYYPDADIYIIQECENPYFVDDDDYRAMFRNGFHVGPHAQGLALFAKENVRLLRLPWKSLGAEGYSFAPTLVDGKFTIIPTWTQPRYTKELHDFLDENMKRFDEDVIMIGDFNSSAVFDDKQPKGRTHTDFVNRMIECGLYPIYHHQTGEEQGKESMATYYHYYRRSEPFHIDHVFANPERIKKFEITPIETHDFWLKFSNHIPIMIEI